MRKLIFAIVCSLMMINNATSQIVTDESGNKIYNESSIAIFTRVSKYNVNSQSNLSEAIPGSLEKELKIGMQAMATSAARNQGVIVVNREDEIFRVVQSWIEESKAEDYIDGISVRAKQIGATHILIQDIRVYSYGNAYLVFEILRNIINVQTNVSCKRVEKYWSGLTGQGMSPADIIAKEKESLRAYFMAAFPVFFVVNSIKGNKVSLAATSLFGIDNSDKIYFYNWENVQSYCQGRLFDFSKMELQSVGTDPKLSGGYINVKLDKKINISNNIVVKLGDCLHSELNTYHHIPIAVESLHAYGNTIEDYCKHQINNAVYNSLYNYPAVNLIESEDLYLAKKERELQKSEEFIDGAVIEQFKASGARYIISLCDFARSNMIVNFRLALIDVATGIVEKEVAIKCHVSNIEQAVDYNITKFFISPIAFGLTSKKQMLVYPLYPIATNENEHFTILYNRPISNPMTGELVYNRVELAKGVLKKWNGQEYVLNITEIVDKDVYERLESIKNSGLFFLQKDKKEPSNLLKDNTIILN